MVSIENLNEFSIWNNMKMKMSRMMKRWKGLGGKLESSDKAIRRTINRQGSSYKELFSRCPSIGKTFTTWEQLLGVVGVRFHCLALFTTFDLGLFKNSHKFHESIPERAFCLAILQEKKTVCDQWGDLSKWKLIRTWLTNNTYSKSIQGQDKASYHAPKCGPQVQATVECRNGYSLAQVGMRSACIPAKDMKVK